jgi:hypothetical protein
LTAVEPLKQFVCIEVIVVKAPAAERHNVAAWPVIAGRRKRIARKPRNFTMRNWPT